MKNKCKRVLALILTLTTCLSILPASVLAAETNVQSSVSEVPVSSTEEEVAQAAEQGDEVSPTTMDASGKCGKNVNWIYDSKTKTLTISGKGAMYNYPSTVMDPDDDDDLPPWDKLELTVDKIVINKGVTTVGSYAFVDTYPKSVSISNTVTSIGECAFFAYYGENLKSIKIPESVKSIGAYAFEGQLGLTKITIPKSVKQIGEGAFHLTNIKRVYFKGDAPSIGADAFEVFDAYGEKLQPITFYYPKANKTWTSSKRKNYGAVKATWKTWNISASISIAKVSVTGVNKSYEYTGKAITPKPKLSYSGSTLIKGPDYTLSYKNNIKKGTATILIKGKGKYTGSKTVTFKIVKTPSIKLSKTTLTLSLAGTKTFTLTATKKNLSGSIKWKTSNKQIADVKNGRITAKGTGTATITAYIGKTKATCKITVKDTATKTLTFDCASIDKWINSVNTKERSMIFGGSLAIKADGSTYYTGNVIAKRKVLSYKTIKAKVSLNTPGYYTTVTVKLPYQVKYTLHRHSLSNDLSSESVGKIMANIVDQKFVWTQKCSCGLADEITWVIPLPKLPKEYTSEVIAAPVEYTISAPK